MNITVFNRVIISGVFALLLCSGCGSSSRDPEVMLGHWKSLRDKPDITIMKDSLHYYAIVYHRLSKGEVCPVRYPLIYDAFSTYIQAEGRILMTYSNKNKTLFLSPGGKYCLLVLE